MRLFPSLALTLLLSLPAAANPERWAQEWPNTDFSRSSVAFDSIMSGGPPRDGIPAIDDPRLIEVAMEARLDPLEPVIVVELEGERPRAYPVRYLTWHEIVNDVVGGVPIAVTFCPLCNSAITFDRRVGGEVLSFGVTGKLRNSDMVMYDEQTQSWWQQAVGQAIVGELTGTVLQSVPTWMESWEEFRSRESDGLVMAEPAYNRSYGRNPYAGYDSLNRPFLYSGEEPPHGIEPLSRVVRVGDRAWPLDRLSKEQQISEAGVQISWQAGQASALDSAEIDKGKDVGSIRVRDAQGRDLPHDVMFAFAFDAFWPEGEWMLGR